MARFVHLLDWWFDEHLCVLSWTHTGKLGWKGASCSVDPGALKPQIKLFWGLRTCLRHVFAWQPPCLRSAFHWSKTYSVNLEEAIWEMGCGRWDLG